MRALCYARHRRCAAEEVVGQDVDRYRRVPLGDGRVIHGVRHRCDGHRHGGRFGYTVRRGGRVVERIGAVPVRVRGISDRVVSVDHYRAVGALRYVGHRRRAGERIVGQDADRHRRIFICGVRVIHGVRHRCHGDRHGGRFGNAVRCGGRVVERIAAPPVRVRRVGDRIIAVDHHRAVGTLRYAGHRWRAGESIVGQDTDRYRRIFIRAVRVIHDVCHRCDGHRHGGRFGHAVRRAGRVGEAVRAVPVVIRCVGDRLASVDQHRAVGTVGYAAHRQRAGEQVVGQDTDRYRRIFTRGIRVIHGVGDRRYGHRHGGCIGHDAVVGHVGETVRAVPVVIRGVGDRVVSVDHHRAVGALGYAGHRRRAGEHIVGQGVDRYRLILVGIRTVRHGRRHRHRHGGRFGDTVRRDGRVGEAVRAVIVQRGRIDQRVAPVDRHRAVCALRYVGYRRRAAEQVIGQDTDRYRRVPLGHGHVIHGVRHRRHGHRHRGRLGHAARSHRVGEAVRAVPVRIRGIGNRVGGTDVDCNRAVGAVADSRDPRCAFEGVVGQDIDRHRRVFIRTLRVVHDVRHRRHGYRHGGRFGHAVRRGGRVGETVRAVPVRIRRIGDRVVSVDHRRAVGARRYARHRRRAGERIVGQDADRYRRIFIRAVRVIHGVRHRRHGHRHGGRFGHAVRRGGRIVERIAAPPVRLRRVADRVISVDHHSAVGALRYVRHRRRAGERIVGQHIDRYRRIFIRGTHVIHGVRHRRHGHRYRGRFGRTAGAGRVGKTIRAVPVVIRCVGDRVITVDRYRAVRALAYCRHRRRAGDCIVGQHRDRRRRVLGRRCRVGLHFMHGDGDGFPIAEKGHPIVRDTEDQRVSTRPLLGRGRPEERAGLFIQRRAVGKWRLVG